ncbi:hypothetical protein NW752_000110 [Fusarium irregulare]|uniref:F-box domain-containing protein n=1 Tax=Fusarium irregulare TaxID=2494466 RepID=A0A9W8Q0I3_9HYPO|nr:hypothetical protein NW766_001725 [Fusarium irregulare]KAJ4027864.1 hypothetical protein NW752_000110 [Fusarium irregulare]
MRYITRDTVACFELLPPEILLPIVTSLPSLDTLWNLMRASPHIWRLFSSSHALTITEGILSGPNSILPPKFQELIRGVILVRSKALPFRNLDEFQTQFLRGVVPIREPEDAKLITLGPESLFTSIVPLPILQSVIATAYQISVLSQACLSSYLARLKTVRPLHAFNPKPYYTHGYGPNDDWVAAWDREFVGIPAKVVDAGQPSWVEEMRALRAIWIIQLVGEIKGVVGDKIGKSWAKEDIDILSQMNAADLVERPDGSISKAEEIRTAMDYLTSLGRAQYDNYYRLPRPPPFSESPGWITASPESSKVFRAVWGYRRNGQIHRLEKGTAIPEDSTPLRRPLLSENARWEQTEEFLSRESSGVSSWAVLTIGPGNSSPIPGVKFDSFRRLGFAFWDKRRMCLLGLTWDLDGRGYSNEFYLFALESILPPDEVANLKVELRKKGQIFYSDS